MVVAILIGAAITAVVIFAVSETPLESLRCMFFGPISGGCGIFLTCSS